MRLYDFLEDVAVFLFILVCAVGIGSLIVSAFAGIAEAEVLETAEPPQVSCEGLKTVEVKTHPPQALPLPLTGEQTEPEEQPETVTMIATAYCGCVECCGKDDRITATGTRATEGRTIAADPHVLPYGTHVVIDGNEYIVEDCGGGIEGNRLDLYFESHEDALRYGVRTVEVEVKS